MFQHAVRILIAVSIVSLPGMESGMCGVRGKAGTAASDSTYRLISINRTRLYLNDRGGLFENSPSYPGHHVELDGTYVNNDPIIYDQGPWIIGKVGGVPSAGIAYWGTSYMPGPVIDGKPGLRVRPQDSLRYHPYRINASMSLLDSDVVAWPADLGAPVTSDGRPRLLGDELVWSVFNDSDSTGHPPYLGDFQPLPHMPVEIQQSVYGRQGSDTDTTLLANTLFIEWTFINKGTSVVDSCFLGLWTDIDFDDEEENFPAVDTTAQLGYCWDGRANPLAPPYAVGYVLLYGPAVPDPSGTAEFCGRARPGYRNLPMTSFWGIIFGYASSAFPLGSGPTTVAEAWNIARGFDRAGSAIIDSVTGLPTRFPFSGDPVTNTGWVYDLPYRKGEEGLMMFTGPFTLAPGDTQWMMTALLPGLGNDPFESIRQLRAGAQRLRAMPYDSIARAHPLIPPPLPANPILYQNYPNPFNPATIIRYYLPSSMPVTISVFDVLGRKVRTLVQETQSIGIREVGFDANGLASGMYFCRMQAGGSVQTKKLLVLR